MDTLHRDDAHAGVKLPSVQELRNRIAHIDESARALRSTVTWLRALSDPSFDHEIKPTPGRFTVHHAGPEGLHTTRVVGACAIGYAGLQIIRERCPQLYLKQTLPTAMLLESLACGEEEVRHALDLAMKLFDNDYYKGCADTLELCAKELETLSKRHQLDVETHEKLVAAKQRNDDKGVLPNGGGLLTNLVLHTDESKTLTEEAWQQAIAAFKFQHGGFKAHKIEWVNDEPAVADETGYILGDLQISDERTHDSCVLVEA